MRFLLENRRLVIIITVIATLFVSLGFFRLKMDSSIAAVLPSGNDEFVFNEKMNEVFGASDQAVVILTAKDTIYSEKNILIIDEITKYLRSCDEVDQTALASVVSVYNQFLSSVEPDKSEEERVIDETYVENIKKFISENPLTKGQLVSSNETITLINVPLNGEVLNNEKDRVSFINLMIKTIKEKNSNSDLEIEFTGEPVINSDITKYMTQDLIYLFPITVIVVMLSIFFLLRNLKAVLVPLIITLLSVVWTFAVKGVFGVPLTLTETVIPVVLISIACADGLHITHQALFFINQGVPGKAAAQDSMKLVGTPVVLSALTTAIGFGSLVFSPGKSMKNMGIFLFFGVVMAMIFTLYLAPIMISYFTPPDSKNLMKFSERNSKTGAVTNFVSKFTKGILKFKWLVLVLTLAVIALCIPGMLKINTDQDEVRYFKDDAPVRIATEKLEKKMGGITTVYLILESQKPLTQITSIVDNINIMEKIEETAKAKMPNEVSFTTSYATYIKYYNKIMGGDFQLPDSRGTYFLYNKAIRNNNQFKTEIKKYINDDQKLACIQIRLKDSNTLNIQELEENLEPTLAELGLYKYDADSIPKNAITYRYAGDYIKIKAGRTVVDSQVNSLIVAIIAIFVLLSIIFKSPLVGLLVTIPVSIAVFINFTIMWLAGISLNPATSIIASVGIGAGVDFAIHYYSRFKNIYLVNRDYKVSIIEAVLRSYKSIFSNAISVAIGFLVLLFSNYTIIQSFGWIVAVTMIISALGALTVLPALLYIIKPKIRN